MSSPVDAVTFEIIRHRLNQVIEESIIALENVSGSPVTNEGHDMMVSLYGPDGGLAVGGVGFLHHLTSAAQAVKHILANFADDPGATPTRPRSPGAPSSPPAASPRSECASCMPITASPRSERCRPSCSRAPRPACARGSPSCQTAPGAPVSTSTCRAGCPESSWPRPRRATG